MRYKYLVWVFFLSSLMGLSGSCKKNDTDSGDNSTKKDTAVIVIPPFQDPHLWLAANTTTTGTNTDIQFTSADTGFVFGSNSYPFIYKTTDAGHNWQLIKQFDGTSPNFSTFFAMNSNRLIVARNELSYITVDGGITFSPLPAQVSSFNVNHFHFFDNVNGLALTGNSAYKTVDGKSWSLTFVNNDGTGYKFIDFPDRNTGYIAGGYPIEINGSKYVTSYGVLAKTIDGGNTWKELSTGSWVTNTQSFHMITGMSFIDSNSGYIATDEQKLLYTNDGASTWSVVNTTLGGNGSFRAILFQNIKTGYYIIGGAIYATANGGVSFTLEYNSNNELLALYQSNDQHLYAVGRNGLILIRKK